MFVREKEGQILAKHIRQFNYPVKMPHFLSGFSYIKENIHHNSVTVTVELYWLFGGVIIGLYFALIIRDFLFKRQ